jgi:hypothetical protein
VVICLEVLSRDLPRITEENHETPQDLRVRVTLQLEVYRQSVRLDAKPLVAHHQSSLGGGGVTEPYERSKSLRNIHSYERVGLSLMKTYYSRHNIVDCRTET